MSRTVAGRIAAVLIGMSPPVYTLDEKNASTDAAYLLSTSVPQAVVTLEGFAGDRHAGFTRRADNRTPFHPRGTVIGNSRQVSLVSVEELALLAVSMGVPTIKAAWLGANLVVEGVPHLSTIPPTTRLFFPDDTTLLVTAQNFPCVFPGKAIQHRYPDMPALDQLFAKHAIGLRGLVAWVERPGTIKTGDAVRFAIPAPAPDDVAG